MVDFKSGKDVEKNKAIVERYVRKAKMYYENNPKVQKLLQEAGEESKKAEKSFQSNKKQELLSNLFVNPWFWFILVAIIGVIMCLLYDGHVKLKKFDRIPGLWLITADFIALVIYIYDRNKSK